VDRQLYEIFAFVVHCHSKTVTTGHYKAYINCDTNWYEFDDENVRVIMPT
jgi:ubiquitin C-terminal hydrolase